MHCLFLLCASDRYLILVVPVKTFLDSEGPTKHEYWKNNFYLKIARARPETALIIPLRHMCTMHVQMYQKDLFVKQIGILSHEQKRSNSFKLFHINQKCGYCINQNLGIFKNYKIALLKIALNPVYTRKWKQKDPVSMLLVHNGMLLLLKSILSTLFVAWPRRKTDRNILSRAFKK